MVWLWIGFIAFVLVMLALDLGVFNRKAHVVSGKEAMRWVLFFVTLALLFNVAVYFIYAHDWLGIGSRYREVVASTTLVHVDSAPHAVEPKTYSDHRLGLRAAGEFFAGWLTEYSLSVDNIFVISLLFTFFAVPAKHQHRVLFWGILGALVMRGLMIGLGSEIVRRWEWVLLFFGAFLLLQGVKLLKPSDEQFDPEKSRIIRWIRRVIPVTTAYHEQKFFVRIDGRRFATPLFLVLIIVEFTDVIFAVDSIPAIFGITRDPFLIFTSNVFAIMGLRSLYFALASLVGKFHHLHFSLAVILAGVGVKMLVENAHHARKLSRWVGEGAVSWLPDHSIHVPTALSLGVIVGSLALGVIASLVFSAEHPEPAPRADNH